MLSHIADLERLGLISDDTAESFKNGVRDDDSITVYRDTGNGIFYLDKVARHPRPYTDRADPVQASQRQDITRRARYLKSAVSVLDVGSGDSGFVYKLKHEGRAHRIAALETDPEYLNLVDGITYYASLADVPDDSYDVITCFHVLEHVPSPIEFVCELRRILKPGGDLIVEVPHANDFLIEASESFRQHTFWSEHLILHTNDSLLTLLHYCHFRSINSAPVQRYGLGNHLRWISENWQHLMTNHLGEVGKFVGQIDEGLDSEYRKHVINQNRSDTLLATGIK